MERSLATLGLLALCAGLAGVVWWELERAPAARSVELASVEAAPPAPAPEAAGIRLPPLDQYDAIVQRPLFNETRAPIESAPGAEAGSAPARAAERAFEELTLTGVVISADKLIALIKDVRAGTVHRVEPGAPLGAWRLERVDAESVTLRNEDTERTLTLYKREPPSPAGAAQSLRPPARTQQQRR